MDRKEIVVKHVMKQIIIESQKNCEDIIIIDADTEYTEVETKKQHLKGGNINAKIKIHSKKKV